MATIKALRRNSGLTQAQLAEKVGCAQKDVSRWENGEHSPSTDALRRLAAALGCSMDDITPSPKKLKMSDVLTAEGYAALTPEERRFTLKVEQTKEYSKWGRYPATWDKLYERIPEEWWGLYSAEHIAEVIDMLERAFSDGRAYQNLDK